MDANGNIVVTGSVKGAVDFGNGNLTFGDSSGQVFIAKYSSSGIWQWHKRIASHNNPGYSVTIDNDQNVIGTGAFAGTVNFEEVSLSTGGATKNAYVVKYAP